MRHERIRVHKEQLEMLLGDIDELASYIETLVNWCYDRGYEDGKKHDER